MLDKTSNDIDDKGKLNINVGSGLDVVPGFISLDNSPYLKFARIWQPILRLFLSHDKLEIVKDARQALETGHFIQHDCRKKLPFPDSSVDHILCSHFLEHVYPDEMSLILEDFHRVLRPGGTFHLIVPHLERFVNIYCESQDPLAADEFVRWMLMSVPSKPSLRYRFIAFFLGFEGMKHRWLYDQNSIKEKVLSANMSPLIDLSVPSASYRDWCNESLHICAVKKM
jgi:ubiquinone/menaquinone biosynthesis C-methylase UbiE